LDQLLRVVCSKAAEQSLYIFTLTAAGNDLVGNRVDVLQRVTSQVLQLELESAEASNAIDCGRLKCHNDGTRNAEQFRRYAGHNVTGSMALAFAVVNRFQRSEDEAVIWRTAAGKRKSRNGKCAKNIRVGK